MSVSIVTYPAHHTTTAYNQIMPVYNPIVFTVNSTNKSQCQFRYICDVYVNTTFVKRLKIFPSGANGYGEFKVERVLEDLVSYDLHPNLYGSSLFGINPNSIVFYNLKFGEEYDSSAQCDSGTTIYANSVDSDSVVSFMTFNGALQKREGIYWNDIDYSAIGVTSKFLTGFPNRGLIQLGNQMTFNIFNTSVHKLEVKTYGSTGNLLGTYRYDNPNSGVYTPASKMMFTIGVGPENLNNSTLSSGTQPVITSSVYYYTVQTVAASTAASSELKRIDIDRRDVKWTPHRLWWLGRLGNFDSYTFTMKDSKELSINRTEFNKIFGGLTYLSPGNVWTYNLQDRARTTLNVNAQESNSYISNWLTEDEALWMEELFTSTEVYLQTVNPVICFDSVYFNGDGVNPAITIYVGDTQGISIGDTIKIDIDGDTYAALNANLEVSNVSENASITLTDPTASPAGYVALSGNILQINFDGELEPIIIKSTSWAEKTKNKVKNISYQIDIDKASAVNTQRN